MAYPILLAHGIGPFDRVTNFWRVHRSGIDQDRDDARHYFRRILSGLQDAGFANVFHSNVDFATSVTRRAASLWDNVEAVRSKTGADKVNLIAHSMGGLDARHMMFDLGDRGYAAVASLTTLGTPHRGSPLADFGMRYLGWLIPGLHLLIDLHGFADLTSAACARFNHRAHDRELAAVRDGGLLLQTYAGVTPCRQTFLPLRFGWWIIDRAGRTADEKANDGLVPLSSARWDPEGFPAKLLVEQLDADHLNECARTNGREGYVRLLQSFCGGPPTPLETRMAGVYIAIAHDLRRRGLA